MKKIEYKWLIAAACFLTVFTTLGFCSSSKGVYVTAMTEALGISRSAFSLNDSLRFISTAVLNVFFGKLIMKFGEQRLIAAGFLSLIISSLLYAFAESVWVLYLGGIFLGIGFSWCTTTMVGAIIGKYFTKNRGTVMGAILASNGIGATVAIQVVTPIIDSSKFGYRKAYLLIVLILAVVGVITVAALGKKGEIEEHVPSEKKGREQTWEGTPFSELLKKPYFYMALFSVFIAGMVLQGATSGVSAPLIEDAGFDKSFVALVISISSISLTVFKFLIGFIYDKCGIRVTSTICSLSAVGVMLILAAITFSPLGRALSIAYAILASVALPLETIMLPIYAGDLFGERSYVQTLGIISSVNVAGYAVGAPLANLSFDMTGSYDTALYIFAALMTVGFIVMQVAISISKKEKSKTKTN